ncbi:RNA polymerase sigma factor [bacterium AH-315-K03]|nr:RNA polymerase sigma factor [bacterium AH-315-K03]
METSNPQTCSDNWQINNYDKNMSTAPLVVCSHDTVLMVVTRFGTKLHNYFYSALQSNVDADDLLQELYQRLLSYHHPIHLKSLGAFVHTIALNLLRDRARRINSQHLNCTISIDDVDDIPIEAQDPGRIAGGLEELALINQTLVKLQLECKKAFCLHRLQGLSHKQIALNMGVTVSMVEKHIMQATHKLRKAAHLV